MLTKEADLCDLNLGCNRPPKGRGILRSDKKWPCFWLSSFSFSFFFLLLLLLLLLSQQEKKKKRKGVHRSA